MIYVTTYFPVSSTIRPTMLNIPFLQFRGIRREREREVNIEKEKDLRSQFLSFNACNFMQARQNYIEEKENDEKNYNTMNNGIRN